MELNVRDVAAILHVPEYTVYRLIDEDNLPASQINGQYRFSREELLEWASARNVNPVGIVRGAERASVPANLAEARWRPAALSPPWTAARTKRLSVRIVDKLPLNDGRSRQGLLQLLIAREKDGSTAVGNGIAIPHSRFPVVLPVGAPDFGAVLPRAARRLRHRALGQVDTVFVLVTPTIPMHLQMLARLAAFVQDETVRRLLKERSGHRGTR